MIDVQFYLDINRHKRFIISGCPPNSHKDVSDVFEVVRNRKPVIFNIETTNACNMTCPFCPRTNLMTRPVKTMNPKVFENIVNQIEPHSRELWFDWVQFAQRNYNIPLDEQSENAFFIYILTKSIVLHGYGDPLLDPHIPEYVALLSKKNIPSYFSCNPANIQQNKTERAFGNGLDYIKYSIDSTEESVRGKDKFEWDYHNIMMVLDMKAKRGYDTQVIITMIDLGQDFEALKEKFKGTGVYIYKKSLDQAWMLGRDAPKSIHWAEFCQFPWSSMSVNSSGMVVPCGEDYDSEMILGNTQIDSLEDIWNGLAYDEFRQSHINATKERCVARCDMRVIGELL